MTNIVSAITGVFTEMAEWFTSIIPSVMSLFYVPETGLTVLGVLAIASLGISICLLVVNIISSFLRFQ